MRKIRKHILYILKQISLPILILESLIGFSQDITPPDIPVIDSVTVQWINPSNPNGDILITWQKCDSTDIRSYYIKYLSEILGTYKLLDSVDANTTSYLDTKTITDPHYPQTYVVQAVDSSNNTSNHSQPHKTVRVFPWQKDEDCLVKVELSWNSYLGWTEGVDYYDIYVVENSIHNYIGRFQEDILSYVYPISGNSNFYEFYIRTTSNTGRKSTSNKIPFTPEISTIPSFIDNQYVSVENNQIHLLFNLDSLADLNNYQLMRSTDTLGNFQSIMTFNNYSKSYLNITDSDTEVDKHQYFYKLNLYNDCKTLVKSSKTISSILLEGESNTDYYYQTLNWSRYYHEGLYQNNHVLYRSSESESAKNIFSSNSQLQYKDDLKTQNIESFVGDFCYEIQVVSDPNTGIISHSNTVCLSQSPSVFMPTAFAPYGMQENRIFKPSFAFISSNNYYFSIYDRFGMLIFDTNNYNEGWNGINNKSNGNKIYPNGIYVYYLRYYSSSGKEFIKTGSFNLLN